MRNDCAAAIPETIDRELARDIHAAMQASKSGGIELAAVRMRFSGEKRIISLQLLQASSSEPCELPIPLDFTAPEMARDCFEGQPVVTISSSLVLIGPRRLEDLTNHGAYLLACHQVGYSISEMYRFAVTLGVASTAVGGFSWRNLAAYVGLPDFYPLMAHAFGFGVGTGSKQDTDAWHLASVPRAPEGHSNDPLRKARPLERQQ